MTLPASGPIWLSQIKTEFGGPDFKLSSYYRGQGHTTTNPSNGNVSAVPGSIISLGNFHGARSVVPGAWDQLTPGQYDVAVPEYQWLRMRAWGGGGGAAQLNITSGGINGEASVISGYISAGGGAGGPYSSASAAGGIATGGNVENLPGGPSVQGSAAAYTGGGSSPYGGAGGSPDYDRLTLLGRPGEPPGGGGGAVNGSGGGGGAFSHSYFENGFAATLDIHVGNGGPSLGSRSGPGAPGRVLIEWG